MKPVNVGSITWQTRERDGDEWMSVEEKIRQSELSLDPRWCPSRRAFYVLLLFTKLSSHKAATRMQFRIQSSHFAMLKRKFMPAGMIHVSGKSYGRTQPLDVLKNLRRQAIFREKTSATSEMKKIAPRPTQLQNTRSRNLSQPRSHLLNCVSNFLALTSNAFIANKTENNSSLSSWRHHWRALFTCLLNDGASENGCRIARWFICLLMIRRKISRRRMTSHDDDTSPIRLNHYVN